MPKKEKAVLSKYKIFESDQFIDDIKILQSELREKFLNKLIDYIYPQISLCPQYGPNIKKLNSYKPETWRYRYGKYRIFYEIDEKEKLILIIAFYDRQDAY